MGRNCTEGGRRAVTLKDIAQKTGFSVNTVSHALQNKPDISETTKEVIRAAADEMGYIGNSFASFLRSGVSKIVAIILGDISNPHFSIMVKEIEMLLKKRGYTSFVLNTDEDSALEREAIVVALRQNVDGVILCPSPGGGENVRFLLERETPFVLIGRRMEGAEADCVRCDDRGGGYLATKHLLQNGHRSILFLNGDPAISSSRERQEGYCAALAEAEVPLREELIENVPVTLGGGHRRLLEILAGTDCTAVLAFSDMIAWETVYALNQLGLHVPEDRSVVGFDNIQSRFPFPVRLTTVSASKATMAGRAVELLFERIGEPERPWREIVIETKLVVRETVRRL